MRINSGLGALGCAGVAAGLMYLFDPNMGSRRRAILRDKGIRLARQTTGAVDKTSRDVKNRVLGIVSLASRVNKEDVSDDILVERVRSSMGRSIAHPGAVCVAAQNGTVTLSGDILSEELPGLLRNVSSINGVRRIRDEVHVHDEPGDISSLQGGRTRRGSRFALFGGGLTILAVTNKSIRQLAGGGSSTIQKQASKPILRRVIQIEFSHKEDKLKTRFVNFVPLCG